MSNLLQTERLLIRPFRLSDAAGFHAMNAVEQVLRYTGDQAFASVEEAELFIRNYDHYHRYGYGRWALEDRQTGEFIGFCGLKYHPHEDEVDLGFRIPVAHWGKGLATEAAKACLDYGFDRLNMNRIIGRVAKANLASIRVLEKIGMAYCRDFDFDGLPGVIYEIYRS